MLTRARGRFDSSAIEGIAADDPRLAQLDNKWIRLGHDGIGMEAYSEHRSRAVLAFACECVRAGIADEVIASCLMHWKIGEHIREQANVNRALNRILERARQFVEELQAVRDERAALRIADRRQDAGGHLGRRSRLPRAQDHRQVLVVRRLQGAARQVPPHLSGQGRRRKPQTVTVALGTWWISQPDRRQYDGGMRFMPQKDEDVVNGVLNLWQGLPSRRASRTARAAQPGASCSSITD